MGSEMCIRDRPKDEGGGSSSSSSSKSAATEKGGGRSVICSSSCKNMNSSSIYTPYQLFGANMREKVEWPEKTDICCWYCCHRFDTQPVCIPANHNQLERYFEVFGIFCSWNCAKSYIQQSYSSESSEQLMWMRIMAKQVFGTTLKQFHAAPPRIFLKMFGGHLTIEEFRRTSTISNTVAVTPPLVSYPIVQQEVKDQAWDTSPTSSSSTTFNPSMLAGRVVGLRRPANSSSSRTKAKQPEGNGMYSAFVHQKDRRDAEDDLSSDLTGGAAKESSSASTVAPDLPRGKGTLASFIRTRNNA